MSQTIDVTGLPPDAVRRLQSLVDALRKQFDPAAGAEPPATEVPPRSYLPRSGSSGSVPGPRVTRSGTSRSTTTGEASTTGAVSEHPGRRQHSAPGRRAGAPDVPGGPGCDDRTSAPGAYPLHRTAGALRILGRLHPADGCEWSREDRRGSSRGVGHHQGRLHPPRRHLGDPPAVGIARSDARGDREERPRRPAGRGDARPRRHAPAHVQRPGLPPVHRCHRTHAHSAFTRSVSPAE